MVKNNIEVFWTKTAQSQLKELYEYISQVSLQNAIQVVSALTEAVEDTAKHPQKYKIDKYKKENDGTYRAFEKHHIRISYRNENNAIRILRVRHTKMNPMNF